MATKYKIWVEIERIDNAGTDDETYTNEDCPRGIAYRDSIKEAAELADMIENTFSELPVAPMKVFDDFIENADMPQD
jgi:hypothetical protein